MPQLRRYQVFISHAWHRSEDYYKVVQFLNDAPNLAWRNLSVPEHDAVRDPEPSAKLRDQMRPADVFLIIAGMYAAHSDFELNFARRIGRPIIGLEKWGSQRAPAAIRSAAVEMVGWNGASVVTAIREHALPSGN